MSHIPHDVLEWCDEIDATARNMLGHADRIELLYPELAERQRLAALRLLGASSQLRETARWFAELAPPITEGGAVIEYGPITRVPGYWCATCARERHNTRYCPVCEGPITLPPSARALAPQTGVSAEVQADVVPPTLLGHHGRAEGLAPAAIDRTHLTIFNETAHQLWFRATFSPHDRKLSITVEPMPARPAPIKGRLPR